MKKLYYILILLLVVQNVFSADSVIGKWRGSILVDGLPVVVTITVDSLVLDENSMSIKYGRPRKCEANAEYGGAIDKEQIFYFSKTNINSWCEVHLRPYKKQPLIKLNMTKSGKISYELFEGKKRLEGGIVERIK